MIPSEPLDDLNELQLQMLTLDAWLSGPRGRYIVRREQQWMDATVPDLFGFRAVQLGTRMLDGLRENRIPHRAYLTQGLAASHPLDATPLSPPDCVANFLELPFESQSLDLIVMPHVLEFSEDPHQLLREVERVLMPEGRVIITGFNPMSAWGLHHGLFKRWGKIWPDGCQPLHISRLKDWLKLLSFEPELGRFGCYRLPFASEKKLERMDFMEKAGDRWWPVCGAVYFVCAVKRVRGMRLVGPAFKQKRLSVKNLKPAASQQLINQKPDDGHTPCS
ncbi:MAG TPA: class I SAM-dependent methyltransferase [Limnobacter sp.]|uniref:Methyltransferase type 11 domain-containing protein n=2 Tax=Burkholderiaceae TaxID=119060 RepID=A0ABQ5YTQ5_9BURK|nr:MULTISPECIES: class I SAM-dependent methyltransferase [Limnobacter]GLR26775.1 hypothetical protein GCM10007875_18650 [Limnobacter litoralis]HEX5486801.1 class I SAM-dependent methyltransferase [Limnobacter sp.]